MINTDAAGKIPSTWCSHFTFTWNTICMPSQTKIICLESSPLGESPFHRSMSPDLPEVLLKIHDITDIGKVGYMMKYKTPLRNPSDRLAQFILVCFILSGMTALIYQIVRMRMISRSLVAPMLPSHP